MKKFYHQSSYYEKLLFLSLDSQRPSTPPPVMPEKTKIHLRSNQPHSLNPSSNQKTTQHSKVKSGHSSTQGLDAPSASKNKRVKDVKSQNAKVKALFFKINQVLDKFRMLSVVYITLFTENL